MRQDGGVLSYTVLRNADPVLGEPELTEQSSATRALDGVVASLGAAAGGDGGDTGQALSQFDIGYVLLPAPIDQTLAHQLNGAAGLVPLTVAPAYDLWQVSGTVARVRVIGTDGSVVPVPSGPIGVQTVLAPGTAGTLVLAEAAGGWSATLDGKPLARLAAPVDGWAQGFVLPAGGGRLVITRDERARDISLAGEAVAVLVAFALALPGTRTAAAAPAGEAETEPGAETAPAAGRRREHASGPRLARHKPRPQVALAASRTRAADAVGIAEFRAADGADAGLASADIYASGPAAAQPQTHAAHGTGPAAGLGMQAGHVAGHPFGPDTERSAGYGPGPAMSPEPRADEGAFSRPPPGPGAGAPSGAPRRPRGQHAARHGKPPRRWRGGPGRRSEAGPPEVVPPSVLTAPGTDGTSRDYTLENLDFDPGDDSGELAPWPVSDPTATDPGSSWEFGDRP